MDKELLALLACPACRGEITLLPDGDGLLCAKCAKVYPVEDDIPILLIEQAIDSDLWEKNKPGNRETPGK